jgi:serine/threonine-protein kinase PknG
MHTLARVETARALIGRVASKPGPGAEELAGASETVEALALEGMERYRLSQQILETALDLVTSRAVPPSASVRILGKPLREADLRRGLEESFRAMAHLTRGPAKVQLVDEANRVRPRTLF